MPARHVAVGRPVHEGERQGIRALLEALPGSYVVFTNVELPTGRSGQTFEHDAVVLAPHAVFTVELKSWGGIVRGNRDRWTLEGDARVPSPIPLVLSKARVLKGQLAARRADLSDVWVQGLVFLSAPDADPQITADFEEFVATRKDIVRALTDPSWLARHRGITPTQRRAIESFLADGQPRRQDDRLGDFRLLDRLPSDDRPYEIWTARASFTGERRVLHVYTVAGDTKAERERHRNHALREATLHTRLQGGPDVLRYVAYFLTEEDPQRIVLQFEDTTPLLPADAWIAEHRPALSARLAVAARLARALSWVHAREMVHRRLSTEALMVSPEEQPTEVRLCAFDLARDLSGAAPTITGSSLVSRAFRCVAPEVLRTAEATARSDLFSLGATLFELLAGRPLYQSVDEILRRTDVPALHVGERPVPQRLTDLVHRLLAQDPEDRPASAEDVAREFEAIVEDASEKRRVGELRPGDVLRDVYELDERIGRGATGTTWKAKQLQTNRTCVLKIADAAHAPLLQQEGRVLDEARHECLVRAYNVEPLDDGNVLVLDFVDGVTARLWIGAGDPLDPDAFLGIARGLLGALGALHTSGWLHRDVKPENLMIVEPGPRPVLLDVGLAQPTGQEGDLAVGTVRYKDPLVYEEGRWSAANDQYASFLVLYELLTGTHPFGTGTPDTGREPRVDAEEFPECFEADAAARLVEVFRGAFSPSRETRPTSLPAALDQLERALADASAPTRLPLPGRSFLPDDATPETPVTDLPLSTRGHGALSRLGVRKVAQLAGLAPKDARRLPNVGAKTFRELRALVEEVERRWPELEPTPVGEQERLYPELRSDDRPLADLGRALTARIVQALRDQGVHTVGELAVMPLFAVEALPHMGTERLERLRKALRRLAGRDEGPEDLDGLASELQAELGAGTWAALATVFGLGDGVPHSISEAAPLVGVTRQRISQATDLAPLREPTSAARALLTLVDEALPAAGFASLDAVATAITTRLPSRGEHTSALGFARLAALLLRDDARAAEAQAVALVARPPWTPYRLDALRAALPQQADWPPRPRREVEAALWDGLDDDLQRALVRWGADAPQLLDALLRVADGVLSDRRGGLFTPPVALSDALALLRPTLGPRLTTGVLLAEAQNAYQAVDEPEDVDAAIAAAGYRREVELWVDPDRIEEAEAPIVPVVDADIPRQRVGGGRIPPVVEALLAAAERGGVRVVALPPDRHHDLGRTLAGWLAEHHGAERVDYLHVDRVLLQALKHADYWPFVEHAEREALRGGRTDLGWARSELEAALDDALKAAAPGRITVLGQPALLGSLGLMSWLSGFYERARGGRYGLVVLAIPGGIHDSRVRLNERYNLPYTPDMAAVYLQAEEQR